MLKLEVDPPTPPHPRNSRFMNRSLWGQPSHARLRSVQWRSGPASNQAMLIKDRFSAWRCSTLQICAKELAPQTMFLNNADFADIADSADTFLREQPRP